MSVAVTVGEFEGPLGVLLELVERNQLLVTEISVATITAQYIERLDSIKQQRDPAHLSEFLQLGARLLYIKSLALLPRTSATEQAEELHQLNLELEEYRRFQLAARELGRLAGSSWERPVTSRLDPHELPLPDVSLQQLAEAFGRALKRATPAERPGLIRAHISQETVARRLQDQLKRGPVELQQLLDEARDRLEVIVTFLATLELVRGGAIRVTQSGQFAPIMLEATHA